MQLVFRFAGQNRRFGEREVRRLDALLRSTGFGGCVKVDDALVIAFDKVKENAAALKATDPIGFVTERDAACKRAAELCMKTSDYPITLSDYARVE